eukprot:gene23618-biopygen1277
MDVQGSPAVVWSRNSMSDVCCTRTAQNRGGTDHICIDQPLVKLTRPDMEQCGHFLGHLPKLAKSGLKHAPQRRRDTRSLPMGPIDGTHGCPQKTGSRKHRKSSKMQGIMPDTVQEWHAEEVIFGAFWRILLAFWHPKLAKSGLKHAPQRRGDIRSLPMGPID